MSPSDISCFQMVGFMIQMSQVYEVLVYQEINVLTMGIQRNINNSTRTPPGPECPQGDGVLGVLSPVRKRGGTLKRLNPRTGDGEAGMSNPEKAL